LAQVQPPWAGRVGWHSQQAVGDPCLQVLHMSPFPHMEQVAPLGWL